MPGPGLTMLQSMIPMGEARWIQLTGEHMTAQRAYDVGLIQALLPDRDALMAEAVRLARHPQGQRSPLGGGHQTGDQRIRVDIAGVFPDGGQSGAGAGGQVGRHQGGSQGLCREASRRVAEALETSCATRSDPGE